MMNRDRGTHIPRDNTEYMVVKRIIHCLISFYVARAKHSPHQDHGDERVMTLVRARLPETEPVVRAAPGEKKNRSGGQIFIHPQ